jgi:hypothetical protein
MHEVLAQMLEPASDVVITVQPEPSTECTCTNTSDLAGEERLEGLYISRIRQEANLVHELG